MDRIFGKKEDSGKEIERKLKVNQQSENSNGAIQVSDVYNITGVGIVVVGEVVEGNIKPGYVSEVRGSQIEIKAIETNHKKMDIVVVSDKSGFILKGVYKSLDIKKGEVLYFHPKLIFH
jgi:translation elongation factor EF-1alpha